MRELLYGVGFHNNKTLYLKEASQTLVRDYEGDIPKTLEGLLGLKGVGRKMANIVMHCAWNSFHGIAVDGHVHRISNRLGWAKTKTPEETELALEDCIPRKAWEDINLLLVGFGQQICRPVKPLCAVCEARPYCPVGRKLRVPKIVMEENPEL